MCDIGDLNVRDIRICLRVCKGKRERNDEREMTMDKEGSKSKIEATWKLHSMFAYT